MLNWRKWFSEQDRVSHTTLIRLLNEHPLIEDRSVIIETSIPNSKDMASGQAAYPPYIRITTE